MYQRPQTHRPLILICCLVVLLTASELLAKSPTTLVVHGVLRSNAGQGLAPDGAYDVTFRIYDQPKGGVAAWSEGPVKIDVVGGRFAYTLGSVKPLGAKLFVGLDDAWLAVKLGVDPEMPREPIRAVAWAMVAAGLDCSGCGTGAQLGSGTVSADKVDFKFAGAKTKGGPASAALDLTCTGCVSVSEMAFDADVDASGQTVKAKFLVASAVTANNFIGDGSKLTGIKTPAGTCPGKFDVVHGIKADGSLDCIAGFDPAKLPADGIDEISNGLIHNQFVDTTTSKTVPAKIPDNNPTGVNDELTFPDIGLAQALDVDVDISNSDLSKLKVELWDPANNKHLLYDKGSKGNKLATSYPSKSKPLQGDLGAWVGKNPKGKWRLRVTDYGFTNNKFDGQINSWGVRIKTLSNKKVLVNGQLQVAQTITGGGGAPTTLGNGVYINVTGKPPGCDAKHKGLLYYDNSAGNLVVCDGTCYQVLASSQGGKCEVQDCKPGATICWGDNVALCDANGWTKTITKVCSAPAKYCHGGACTDKKCVLVDKPKYAGKPIAMNTRSHGGGYHPFYDEYWYPQWAGSIVYRYDKAYKYLGSFDSQQASLMQIWGEKDDDTWYSANWGFNTITRRQAKSNIMTWKFNVGSTAGAVTADADKVYAMRHTAATVWVLDKKTGKSLNTITLTGGSLGTTYGTLLVWDDKLYRGNQAKDVYRFDLKTGKHDGMKFTTAANLYNMAFNGQQYCISPNNSSVYCYDLFGATCPK